MSLKSTTKEQSQRHPTMRIGGSKNRDLMGQLSYDSSIEHLKTYQFISRTFQVKIGGSQKPWFNGTSRS